MIEFKAECGHTVRTKDEDAGQVVRCSYCGCETTVPDSSEDDLEFLFKEVEQPVEPRGGGRRRKRRRQRDLFGRRGLARDRFNPFAVVLKMGYVAALVIIVFWVGKKFVLPLFETDGLVKPVTGRTSRRARTGARPAPNQPPSPAHRRGLMTWAARTGLYVGSTPPGATVYCLEVSKAPESGSIRDVPGCFRSVANAKPFAQSDGRYVVEVSLPWTDERLNKASLPDHRDFRSFRKAILRASSQERNELARHYFVPDDADDVFVDQTEEQILFVRQYRDVQVQNGTSKGVRALFLPRIALPRRKAFSIAALVADYIPKEKTYKFNESIVRGELDFWDVPEADRLFVIEALERIGLIPYVTPDGTTRLFKIGITDGVFTTRELTDAPK